MRVLIECPECATRYRVEEERLKAQGYRVRCGRCRYVFDAREHRLQEAVVDNGAPAPVSPTAVPQDQETLPAQTAQPPVTSEEAMHFSDREAHFFNQKTLFDQKTLLESLLTAGESDPVTFSDAKKQAAGRLWRMRLRAIVVFLVLCLVLLSSALLYRNEVVGYFPSLYPWVKSWCRSFSCVVSWPHHPERMRLSALELHVDSDHPNGFVLIGALKNPTSQCVQWPSLHLVLLNIQGMHVGVKEFLPQQYLDMAQKACMMPGEERDVHAVFTLNTSEGIESFRASLHERPQDGRRSRSAHR